MTRRRFPILIGALASIAATDALSSFHHQPPSSPHRHRDRSHASKRTHWHRTSLHVSRSEPTSSTDNVSFQWSKLTVPQLKSQLKDRGLPVSGKKAELVQRILEHESSTTGAERSQNSSKDAKRSAFPPPKDETEIEVVRKEVKETLSLLDGLKIGGSESNTKSNLLQDQSFSTMSSQTTTRQQAQERRMMESLKQSLKKTQQKSTDKSQKAAAEQPRKLSAQESAHAHRVQGYTEQLRLRPANDLKEELLSLRLSTKGRKPDLVHRLAEYLVSHGDEALEDGPGDIQLPELTKSTLLDDIEVPVSFAGIAKLSKTAASALQQAFGNRDEDPEPTPIQLAAIPKMFYAQQSAILHAPTGSGKTVTFLLPITETLWQEVESKEVEVRNKENGMALILLPTRELAAQVAGVATVLAPPGMVRFVPRPMNLMNCWRDEVDAGEEFEYYETSSNGERPTHEKKYKPRILVGSAKSIAVSLFGDSKMPGSPTNKPQGKELLSCVRWLVMDEVDRLLDVKKSRTDKRSRHEKPAAMLSAAVARLTMGRVQVIAASATVGRPLRRELSRVLGLHSSECPETIRGDDDTSKLRDKIKSDEKHVGRAVKIPPTVRNYVLPVDGSTAGSLLTSAAFATKSILQPAKGESCSQKKVLVVLTRNCDIKLHNALGALQHFGIRPRPQSLLDVLEADGADRLVEAHRKVSRVEGVGGKQYSNDEGEGYLLVTHEDNVRGLHLDRLDAVVVVGRPGSPDEYTHIAGRTGRAGRKGSVLNIVSFEQAAALASWTKMLGVDFMPIDESDIASVF